MDLASLLQKEIQTIGETDELQELIRECLRKTIRAQIENHLRQYSDIGKIIEQAVKESLMIDRVKLPLYHQFITELITEEFKRQMPTFGAEKIRELLAGMFKPGPEEITFDDLHEQVIDLCKQDCLDLNDGIIGIDARSGDKTFTLKIKDGFRETEIVFYDFKETGKWSIGYLREDEATISRSAKFEASTVWSDICTLLYKCYLAETKFTGNPEDSFYGDIDVTDLD